MLQEISQQTTFGDFAMDIVLERTPTYESDVTENPVETGFNISDHVNKKPRKLALTVLFTPTSVTWDDGSADVSHLSDIETQLMTLMNDGQILTVKTQDNVYDNMLLTGFTLPRKIDTGYAIKATLNFREVPRVSTQTETIPEEYASSTSTASTTTTDGTSSTADTTSVDTTSVDTSTPQDQAGSTDTDAGDADTSDMDTPTNNTDTEQSGATETATTGSKSILASMVGE